MKKQLLLIACIAALNSTAHAALSSDDSAFIEELSEDHKPVKKMFLKQFFPETVEDNESDLEIEENYEDIIDILNDKKTYRKANGDEIAHAITRTECSSEEKSTLWYSFLHGAMMTSTGNGMQGMPFFYKRAWAKLNKALLVFGLAASGAVGAGVGGYFFKDTNNILLASAIGGGIGLGAGGLGTLIDVFTHHLVGKTMRGFVEYTIENLKRTMITYHNQLPEPVYNDLKTVLMKLDKLPKGGNKKTVLKRHKIALKFFKHVAELSELDWN